MQHRNNLSQFEQAFARSNDYNMNLERIKTHEILQIEIVK